MKTVLLTIALLLMSTSPASAKLRVRIGISVLGEGGNNLESSIRDSVEARVNSTERYMLGIKVGDADLVLEFTCVVIRQVVGVACSSDVTYFPYEGTSLSISVNGAERVASGDTAFVVESLMNRFFNGTTDSELAERRTFLRHGVQSLCINHPKECTVQEH